MWLSGVAAGWHGACASRLAGGVTLGGVRLSHLLGRPSALKMSPGQRHTSLQPLAPGQSQVNPEPLYHICPFGQEFFGGQDTPVAQNRLDGSDVALSACQ